MSAGSEGAVLEPPVFIGLEQTSFSFAFEISFEPGHSAHDVFDRGRDRTAFRLRELAAHFPKDDNESYDSLIRPVRSFLDDVTTGPPGTNGRPLIFAASGAAPDDASRVVHLVRGPNWRYEYEGEETVLEVPAGCRRYEMRLRDSFSAFESGRIFYILTLTQPDEVAPRLDEYAVIQLEQLVIEPERLADAVIEQGFEWPEGTPGGGVLSLIALANLRLAALSGAGAAASGIRDVIHRYGLAPARSPEPLAAKDLLRLCVAIEDGGLVDTAEEAYKSYFSPETVAQANEVGGAKGGVAAHPTAKPATGAGKAWASAHGSADAKGSPRLHRGEGEDIDRGLLAFAGIAQGVPDFPNQDDSEVHDSTRPTARSVESALYTHPRFTLEVAKNWRSYQRGRPCLGTCPYLLLMFLVVTHDELIVADMEVRLEEVLLGRARAAKQGQPFTGVRARPLADVRKVLNEARKWRGGNIDILHANLKHRFELFRWGSIHRSGNIFRYPKEKAALEAIQKAMATAGRFDEAHALIDRLEAIVEDVSSLKSAYAQSRTNFILFVLALLGIIGATKDLGEMLPAGWAMTPLAVAGALVGAILIAFLVRTAARWLNAGGD